MIAYLFRRLFYGALILLGVNLLTFLLFFAVNTPDDMARLALGGKRVSVESIEAWKSAHGYDLPLFWNEKAQGTESVTKTIFWTRSVPLLSFDFGMSDSGRDITTEIKTRMVPSLLLAVPTFLFIITGQWLFGKVMQLVPVSGWSEGAGCVAFLALPVAIGVFAQLGSGTLLYRAMFLEELNKDYVRCVRAKGITETRILFGHVLRNASLPIVTSTVAVIPSLFMGSLIMESFFGIPGLGSYTIDAVNAQDFSVVRAMVFLGTIAYIAGLILTDVVYTWVDPRIRLTNR